jgi:hypothetical protein
MTKSPPPTGAPWPRLSAERLAQALLPLAEQVQEPALRAQLNALATVLSSLPAQRAGDEARAEAERALEEAMGRGDEEAAIELARRLAASDRAAVQAVDWSAVSGG